MDGRVGSPGEAPEPAGMLEEEELRLGERRKAEERQRDRETEREERDREGEEGLGKRIWRLRSQRNDV